eukprot:TRINITY_DN8522_c0_g1_i3.p1 TRINITY_DN8522_c0_g1~~TRINITY_DN8522_c0_g1_i3.p1  ORF type:complete len:145 (+),score=36.66 TRINITY_DN8522_c0_g1_i3:33-467(+)
MELSAKAAEFADTIIRLYGEKKQAKAEGAGENANDKPKETVPVEIVKDKYSVDYTKWEKMPETADEDPTKKLSPEENEYLKQMGCFHDRRKERELYEKSTKEKLDNAKRFKEEGNAALKVKDYEKASYLSVSYTHLTLPTIYSV